MGCISSSSVADEPKQPIKSQNSQKETLKKQHLSVKSMASIKSKTSIKSSFSRKRTKRTKKLNKINLTPQELSIQQNKQNYESRSNSKGRSIKSNVKLRQIHKKLQVEDIIELNNILIQHFFFFKLKKQQRISVIQELKLFEVKKGKHVYELFDKPNQLYIVKEGLIEMQTGNENNPKRFMHKSDCFGQTDVIFDLERSQSVVARQNSKLWALEKWKIQEIKESIVNQNSTLIKTYLQKVATFSYLTTEQMQLISHQMFTLKYRANQPIFMKGDPANTLFIIISGQVQLEIPNKHSLVVKAGQVFGEGCLKLNPPPRIGTATSYVETRCLVISKHDFMKCLGSNHIENIMHFSILKWAFKRSQQFKEEQTTSLYKRIQRGKIEYFKDKQNIFQNCQHFPNYYFVSLQDQVNQFGVGMLVNCSTNSSVKDYIKNGNGHVFLMEIKQPKNIGKSLKMVKFQEKKQCDLRIPLTHLYKQEEFKYNNIQIFFQNLLLIKKIKTTQSTKGDFYNVLSKSDGKFYNIRCIKKLEVIEKNNLEKLLNQKKIAIKGKQCSFLSVNYKTFHDEHFIYYVLKNYQHGSLDMLLDKHKNFSSQIFLHFLLCMMVGIQFFHDKIGAIHRNLTLENIFLDDTGYFSIDNYQNAKIMDSKDSKTYTIIGTPHYLAPEMIDGKGYSFQVDYWAIGVILYRIIYGKFPFTSSNKDPFDIFKQIIKNNVDFKINSKSPHALVQITRLLLISDPKLRMNEKELKNYDIFVEIDREEFEKKNIDPPFNIAMFGIKKVDKKFYEEGKNYFSNFISKEKKKLQQISPQQLANFKSWDFNFD